MVILGFQKRETYVSPFLKKGDIMTLEGEIVIRGGSKTRIVHYLDIITNVVIYHGVLKYCLFLITFIRTNKKRKDSLHRPHKITFKT